MNRRGVGYGSLHSEALSVRYTRRRADNLRADLAQERAGV
jgi:hypothetical protein